MRELGRTNERRALAGARIGPAWEGTWGKGESGWEGVGRQIPGHWSSIVHCSKKVANCTTVSGPGCRMAPGGKRRSMSWCTKRTIQCRSFRFHNGPGLCLILRQLHVGQCASFLICQSDQAWKLSRLYKSTLCTWCRKLALSLTWCWGFTCRNREMANVYSWNLVLKIWYHVLVNPKNY